MEVDNLDIVTAVADAVVAAAVKLGPPPPPLPTGWVLKPSRSNPGYFYYFNMETGVTSWSPPLEIQPQQEGGEEGQNNNENENSNNIQSLNDSNTAAAAADGLPPTTTRGGDSVMAITTDDDPETAEDRSSKRRKVEESSTGNANIIINNNSNSTPPKEVRVLHILKKHKGSRRPSSWRQPNITQSVDEAKEELMGMLEILQEEENNPTELRATFEELARTESDCSSAKRGGDLGFFGRKKMQPAFEAASFALKTGELTKEIVETSSGVHLILRIG